MKTVDKKKYYIGWPEKEVEIVKTFTDKKYNKKLCVVTDGDYFKVLTKDELKPITQTEHYKIKKELKKEIQKLDKEKNKKVIEIQNEAIKSLSSRVKLNIAFGNYGDETAGMIALKIVKELEKLIKKTNKKKGN